MSTENLGGAFLLMNTQDDFEAGLIDLDEVLRRIRLIKMYEAGELSLIGINSIWIN